MDNNRLIETDMPMTPDEQRRLSTVETNYENLNNSMRDIKGYLGKLFDQNGEIKTGLALVVQNQEGMKVYQTKCDSDRTDHEKRIAECEGFQSRLVKAAIAIFGIGSLVSPQISKLWEKVFS